MPAKQLLFETAARAKIFRGIGLLARAVKVTFGPKGRNVILDRNSGPPLITKDGVTVAHEIELSDPFENAGAQLVKEVAAQTSAAAGDGTTTATVLAEAIYAGGLRNLTGGADPRALKRGIDLAVAAVVAELARVSRKIDGHVAIRQVAALSANSDDAIGKIVADAMDRVGADGVILIEEGRSLVTSLAFVEGLQFDKGYLSPYFATDPDRMEADLEQAYVFLHEKKLVDLAPLLPLLQAVAKTGKPLLIIAEEIKGEALSALVANKMRGTLKVCAVAAPGHGDRRRVILEDIATLTNAHFLPDDPRLAPENITLANLGRARLVTVGEKKTTLLTNPDQTGVVANRVRQLKLEMEAATSDFDRAQLQERRARLTHGVAVLTVGGFTEAEVKERKARVDDALHAARAAVAEGVVPGGGVALLRCAAVIDSLNLAGDEKTGAHIVRSALATPLHVLCANAGVEGSIIAAAVAAGTGHFGYNVATGAYEDLVLAGIVDATKVTRLALQHAASIASLLLTVDCIVTDQPTVR